MSNVHWFVIVRRSMVVCLLLAGLFCSAVQAQEDEDLLKVLAYNSTRYSKPPMPQGSFEEIVIPIKRVQNLMMIEAVIDGLSGNFILDTGAPHLVLNKTYFRRGKLADGSAAAGITGTGSTVYHLLIDSLVIGELSYHNVDADLVNLGHLEDSKGVQILGLLGANLFAELEMEIDVRSSSLVLRRLSASGEYSSLAKEQSVNPDLMVDIEILNNVIFLPATAGGKKLRLCLDTGAETNVLSNTAGNKVLQLFELQRRASLTGSGSQKLDVLSGRISSVMIGSRTFEQIPFLLTSLTELQQVYGISLDGILGFDFLAKGRTVINMKSKKLSMYFYQDQE